MVLQKQFKNYSVKGNSVSSFMDRHEVIYINYYKYSEQQFGSRFVVTIACLFPLGPAVVIFYTVFLF